MQEISSRCALSKTLGRNAMDPTLLDPRHSGRSLKGCLNDFLTSRSTYIIALADLVGSSHRQIRRACPPFWPLKTKVVAIDSTRRYLGRSLDPAVHITLQINRHPLLPQTTYLHFLSRSPDNRPLRHRRPRRITKRASLVSLDRQRCVISAIHRTLKGDVGGIAHIGRDEAGKRGIVGGADGYVAHACCGCGRGGQGGGVMEGDGEVCRRVLGPVEVETCYHLDGLAD